MMRRICAVVSYVALAGVWAAPTFYFLDALSKPEMKLGMAVATLLWFVCGGVARSRALPTSV